ncbi:hypothetical protein C2845_PM14G02320 [Panicum miliaceum]|uniref:Pectinesterase inhibitor domain-containing protein n=1 Tax=Panicum miliaceum TaxID=4540 RepID=A0A3L6PNT5_PANMI|nr:hypothetical protein C2845_PM14G02320 [Panicum miliaceum]
MTLVAAVLVSFAALLVAGGEACNNVPSMTSYDACLKLSNTTERWHALCRETLLNAPATAELTVYALVATRLARQRYRNAVAEMDQMLGTGKLPAGEKAAVDHCKAKYGEAGRLMAGVADQLFARDFSRVRQEYIDAQVAVGSCQDGLWAYRGLPVVAMVTADYDLTMVSYLLGALIVGR